MNESDVDARTELQRLSPGIPWRDVAQIVVRVRHAEAWRSAFASDAEWVAAVGDRTGHGPNTIRRYVAAHQFLTWLSDEHPQLGVKEADISSLGAEMLKRIHRISPDEALKAAEKLIAGRHSARTLELRYRQLRAEQPPAALKRRGGKSGEGAEPEDGTADILGSPPVAMKRYSAARDFRFQSVGSQEFKLAAFELVAKNLSKLSPLPDGADAQVNPYVDRYRLPYAGLDVLAIGRRGFQIEFIDGYLFSYSISPRMLDYEMSRIALASTYVRHLWVICSASPHVQAVMEACSELELGTVGVCICSEEQGRAPELQILIGPEPSAVPRPDRRAVALSVVMRQGIPDF